MTHSLRLTGLDVLRGLAVLCVILYHFFELLNLQSNIFHMYLYAIGQLGVLLFFIISGYLIYRSVDYNINNYGTKNGLKYYISHRFFRILPPYYFNFFIVFILALYFAGTMDTWSDTFIKKQIISHLTLTSFFIYKTSGLGINGAYWILSIEILWYIIAPLLFIFIKKDIYLGLLVILSLLYLWGLDSGLLNTFFNLDTHTPNYLNLLFFWSFQLPGQLIYFLVGIFIYKYLKQRMVYTRFIQYTLFIFIISIFLYLSHQEYFLKSITLKNSITLVVTASIFILFYQYKFKELYFLSWTGKISYSLYLCHMPLLFLMKKYMLSYEFPFLFVALLFILVLFIISSISYYKIEEGVFMMRRKFETTILFGHKQ